MKFHEFIVVGSGQFPLDMLRYDECFPLSAEDVEHLSARGRRYVHLGSYKTVGVPTRGRWESFNWRVALSEEIK